MKIKNEIQIFKTTTELAQATAKFIIEIAKNAINARDRFVMAVSGGHTPEQLYTLLSQPPFRDQMPWNRTFVFWGDERCVPLDDEDNNAQMAHTQLLDHVAIPADHIFPIPVNLQPAEAAKEYENTINDFFRNESPAFDLMLLGLGTNGHTASIFPGTNIVFETTHLVKEVYVEEQKMFRITMTAALINQAHQIIFLVAGEDKAAILKTILTAPYQPDKYPAQLIKPVNGDLYWYADDKAAVLLPHDIK